MDNMKFFGFCKDSKCAKEVYTAEEANNTFVKKTDANKVEPSGAGYADIMKVTTPFGNIFKCLCLNNSNLINAVRLPVVNAQFNGAMTPDHLNKLNNTETKLTNFMGNFKVYTGFISMGEGWGIANITLDSGDYCLLSLGLSHDNSSYVFSGYETTITPTVTIENNYVTLVLNDPEASFVGTVYYKLVVMKQ